MISTYTHTQPHAQTLIQCDPHKLADYTKLNLHTTWNSKQRSETNKDSSTERKTWQNTKRSLHKKPSLEKTILRLFLPGTEPETFQLQVAIPRIAEDAVTVSEMETLLNVKWDSMHL